MEDAFEKLLACTKQFPNYDLNKNTKEIYVDKENYIYRDFIKCGVDFIKNYEVTVNNHEVKVKVNDPEEKLAVENAESETDKKVISLPSPRERMKMLPNTM